MAAVSLFWDTNMAAVTSCENTLLTVLQQPVFLFGIVSKRIKLKQQPILRSAYRGLDRRQMQDM